MSVLVCVTGVDRSKSAHAPTNVSMHEPMSCRSFVMRGSRQYAHVRDRSNMTVAPARLQCLTT
eukprot:4321954-Alexandrium_andersonii.AAC.1